MPSPFSGINMASQALRAFQRQQEVAGNNIANVNTPGYSRRSSQLGQAPETTIYGVNPYTMGTGVLVQNVNRMRDMFVEARMQGAVSDQSRFDTLASNLMRVEPVLVEPAGNGVADAMNRFYDSWSALSSNANDPAARLAVQLAGSSLASKIRATHGQLTQHQAEIDTEVQGAIGQINALAVSISDLNKQIQAKIGTGVLPNDLLDARDLAVQDLSKLVDVRTRPAENGAINVYVDQFTLVESRTARALPTTVDVAGGTFDVNGNTYRVRSGKLGGAMTAAANINSYIDKIDNLANALRADVNSLHRSGTNKLGNTGVDFFNDVVPPAFPTGATDFDLSTDVAGNIDAIAAGASGAAGDGGVALSLSRLRDMPSVILGGRSSVQHFHDLVSGVGRDSAYYQDSLDTQKSIVGQIENQRQSVSGVSLDDEMADMMRYQRSYQAAAKALTIFDQMTDDLINMLRR